MSLIAADVDEVRAFFSPERPGPMAFAHVANTGHGSVAVDRWPHPRVAPARSGTPR